MTLTPSSFDDSLFAEDDFLLKKSSEDVPEKIIGAVLFACAFVSVATTFGIVWIIFQETLGFFQEVSLAQFFLDTRCTPLFAEPHFGIWPLLNGTFLTSAIAMAVAGTCWVFSALLHLV